MSYQNYGQNPGQSRYGQNNPYAQQNVQYDPTDGHTQQQAGYGQQDQYGQQQDFSGQQQGGYGLQGGYDQQSGYEQPQPRFAAQREPQNYPNSNYGDQRTNNAYEMGAMNGQNISRKDPNAILNACREVDREIDLLEENLATLTQLRTKAHVEVDEQSQTEHEFDLISKTTKESYSALVARAKKIGSDPMSGMPRNAPQVGRMKRRLEHTMRQYQQIGLEARNQRRDQIERNVRITNPDATEEEIRAAVENPQNGQVFASALMDRDRRGQTQAAVSANRERHKALQELETRLMEVAQMFQDLDAMVIQQEAAIENIDQRGEDVQQNVEQANVQLDGAIKSASAARRKKFWCLGIALLIIIIIVVIVVVVVLVLRNNNNTDSPAPTPAPVTGATARIKMVRVRSMEHMTS